jgi:hypothetical protein
MSENESFKEHENESTVNEGTEAKATLQQRALKYLPKYPQKQTLKAYAEWLCWDLHVSVRTAFDSYIMPLFRREYFKYVGVSPNNGKSMYVFVNQNELIDTSQFKVNQESKESATEYMQRKTKEENKRDFSLDLYNFIKVNNYENLLDSELIEKINKEVKNEKLKANWIKQIKEGSKND